MPCNRDKAGSRPLWLAVALAVCAPLPALAQPAPALYAQCTLEQKHGFAYAHVTVQNASATRLSADLVVELRSGEDTWTSPERAVTLAPDERARFTYRPFGRGRPIDACTIEDAGRALDDRPPGASAPKPRLRVEAPPPRPKHKSPGTALMLSLGVTGLSIPLIASATNSGEGLGIGVAVLLLGPTTGHIYVGSPLSLGLGIRAAGVLLMMAGDFCVVDCRDTSSAGEGVFAAGLILFSYGTLHEIIAAPIAASRYNRRAVTVAPTPIRTRNGWAPGLGVAGTW